MEQQTVNPNSAAQTKNFSGFNRKIEKASTP
jgi:hypothetical protein